MISYVTLEQAIAAGTPLMRFKGGPADGELCGWKIPPWPPDAELLLAIGHMTGMKSWSNRATMAREGVRMDVLLTVSRVYAYGSTSPSHRRAGSTGRFSLPNQSSRYAMYVFVGRVSS